jgi:hypothetical protein
MATLLWQQRHWQGSRQQGTKAKGCSGSSNINAGSSSNSFVKSLCGAHVADEGVVPPWPLLLILLEESVLLWPPWHLMPLLPWTPPWMTVMVEPLMQCLLLILLE